MAKIYSKEDGAIIAVRIDEDEEQEAPVTEYADMLEFDPDTNSDILTNYAQDHNNHNLAGGVLRHNDIPYTIQPDSELYTDRKAFANIRSELRTYYKLENPTNAQSVAAIKGIIRVLGIILDWYLRTQT